MAKHTIKLNCKQVRRSKPLPELSASEVRQMVSGIISEYFGLQADGYSCSTEVVNDVVIKASVEGESIESICQDLDAVPTGHTVRDYLNEQLPTEDLDNIEEQVKAALTTDLPKRVWRGKLELAIDEHDEPFYGKSEELLQYACRGRAKAGTTYFFRVATLYHIHNKIPLTLALTFVRPEDTTLAVVKRLLEQLRNLGIKWSCLYLDKGFCSIPIIRYLQRHRYSAIIACPIRGKTGGTRALCTGRKSYLTRHTFSSAKNGSCEASVAVVRTFDSSGRRKRKRKARWLAYVLINVDLRADQVRARYRSRFGVETSYRVMRTTHTKTTGRNAALRFFLIAFAFILVNVWITLRWRFCQIPRRGGREIDRNRFPSWRMFRFLRRAIEGVYGTVDTVRASAAPLAP
jgi:putative transposase